MAAQANQRRMPFQAPAAGGQSYRLVAAVTPAGGELPPGLECFTGEVGGRQLVVYADAEGQVHLLVRCAFTGGQAVACPMQPTGAASAFGMKPDSGPTGYQSPMGWRFGMNDDGSAYLRKQAVA